MLRKKIVMSLLAIVVIAAGVGLASYVYSGNHAGSADASATSSSTRMKMGGHGSLGGPGGPQGMGNGQPAIVGTVESINGDILTVVGHQGFGGGPRMASSTMTTNFATTTYTVDATNATISKISTPTPPTGADALAPNATSSRPMPTTISISQIQVGDRVMIQGTVSGTSITATNIMDGIPMGGRGHGDFGGPGPGGHGGGRNGWNASSTMPAPSDMDAPPQQ